MSKARDIADRGSSIDSSEITDGAVTAAKLASGAVEGAMVTPSGRRNLIINGAMQVTQRGTSFSLSADAYTLDRWTSSSAGGVSLSVSQQTATSSDNAYFASKNFLRFTRNNAVLSGLVHKVEDLQQFNNKTFTLSFWARSSDITNTLTPTIYTLNDGSTYNSYVSSLVDVSDPALSSTWQKYIYRITFQDMYSYGFSGSHHLRMQLNDSSAAGTVDIAEVQLEVGSVATPFEHRSYGEELALCQRYYWGWNAAGHSAANCSAYARWLTVATSTSRARWFPSHPVEMRASPTLIGSTSAANFQITDYSDNGTATFSGLSVQEGSNFHSQVSFDMTAADLNQGATVSIRWANNPIAYIGFDAEL